MRSILPLYCVLVCLASCATVTPVEIVKASAQTSQLALLVPDEVVLSGRSLDGALGSEPQLAKNARDTLATALGSAGYIVVDDPNAPHDLRLSLTLNANDVSVAVLTGRYARMGGSLVLSDDRGPIDTLDASSHPEDTGYFARYYPSINEATERVVKNLVNAIGQSPAVGETAANKGVLPAPEDALSPRVDPATQGDADATASSGSDAAAADAPADAAATESGATDAAQQPADGAQSTTAPDSTKEPDAAVVP